MTSRKIYPVTQLVHSKSNCWMAMFIYLKNNVQLFHNVCPDCQNKALNSRLSNHFCSSPTIHIFLYVGANLVPISVQVCDKIHFP